MLTGESPEARLATLELKTYSEQAKWFVTQ